MTENVPPLHCILNKVAAWVAVRLERSPHKPYGFCSPWLVEQKYPSTRSFKMASFCILFFEISFVFSTDIP